VIGLCIRCLLWQDSNCRAHCGCAFSFLILQLPEASLGYTLCFKIYSASTHSSLGLNQLSAWLLQRSFYIGRTLPYGRSASIRRNGTGVGPALKSSMSKMTRSWKRSWKLWLCRKVSTPGKLACLEALRLTRSWLIGPRRDA
jgi:hypothetical protein